VAASRLDESAPVTAGAPETPDAGWLAGAALPAEPAARKTRPIDAAATAAAFLLNFMMTTSFLSSFPTPI
jgi:hypothetical protein